MTVKGQEPYPMKGGDGTFSYAKNSTFQKSASSIVRNMISEVMKEKLNIEDFLTPTNTTMAPTIRIADLGCATGPNTFTAMQNVVDNLETQYEALTPGAHHQPRPQFQVFFNDHAGNDFNTLFTSLPSSRAYFSAGVPGSFYGRLFPDSSLHFIHSSYALQWLSKMPEELLAKDSPSWNRERIHYTCAPQEVANAYSRQFSEDMGLFLEMRAQELVVGGMMVLIMPSVPDRSVSHSEVPAGIMFDLLGASLMDMAKEGLIGHEQVDTFNLPIYGVTPQEMQQLVAESGRFSIARMELSDPFSDRTKEACLGTSQETASHCRAGMEGILAKHFGVEVMDELFDRFARKLEGSSDRFMSCHTKGTQMCIALVKN